MTDDVSIDVAMGNAWRNVDLVRTSVQDRVTAAWASVDAGHAIAMVTAELLENALKHGAGRAGARATLRVHGTRHHVTVSVRSPLADHDDRAASLFAALAWIDRHATPAAAHRARLMQIASSDEEGAPSRLGLVRIAFEGNCRLAARVGGGAVTVTAALDLGAA